MVWISPASSFNPRPDKRGWRVERPEGSEQGERSESSRIINKQVSGIHRGDD